MEDNQPVITGHLWAVEVDVMGEPWLEPVRYSMRRSAEHRAGMIAHDLPESEVRVVRVGVFA